MPTSTLQLRHAAATPRGKHAGCTLATPRGKHAGCTQQVQNQRAWLMQVWLLRRMTPNWLYRHRLMHPLIKSLARSTTHSFNRSCDFKPRAELVDQQRRRETYSSTTIADLAARALSIYRGAHVPNTGADQARFFCFLSGMTVVSKKG